MEQGRLRGVCFVASGVRRPRPLALRRAVSPFPIPLWGLGYDLLRKEVIQPLVPQRLPCYDFIPITTHTLGGQMPDFGCRRLS